MLNKYKKLKKSLILKLSFKTASDILIEVHPLHVFLDALTWYVSLITWAAIGWTECLTTRDFNMFLDLSQALWAHSCLGRDMMYWLDKTKFCHQYSHRDRSCPHWKIKFFLQKCWPKVYSVNYFDNIYKIWKSYAWELGVVQTIAQG